MEVIKTAKTFMALGFGLFCGGLLSAVLICPKTNEGEIVLATSSGFLAGSGSVAFALGLGALVGTAEDLVENAATEVV